MKCVVKGQVNIENQIKGEIEFGTYKIWWIYDILLACLTFIWLLSQINQINVEDTKKIRVISRLFR